MSNTPEEPSENSSSEASNLSPEELDSKIKELEDQRNKLEEDSKEKEDDSSDSANVDKDEEAEEKEEDSVEDSDQDQITMKNKLFIAACTLLAIIIGFVSAYFYDSWERGNSATSELTEISENTGDLIGVNTDALEYGGDDDSYALGVGSGSNHPDYGTFVFQNDAQEYNKTLDLYIDYSSQRSVDLMLVNNTMLRDLVESGNVEIRLHPVPSDHPLSMYAAETLAQVMQRHPDKAWEVNTSLLQLHTELRERGAGETITTEEILELIENELSYYHNIEDIDAELIREGMFFDWLSSTAQAPNLSGGAPPLVYSGGELLDNSVYHNSEELREHILSGPEQAEGDAEGENNTDIENGADDESVEEPEEEQGE